MNLLPTSASLLFAIASCYMTMQYACAQDAVAQLKIQSQSEDGKYLLSADNQRRQLDVRDQFNHKLLRQIHIQSKQGKLAQVTSITHHQQRQSFVVALPNIQELWELRYHPKADPVYEGWVHDYQMGEGIADHGLFAVRRIRLDIAIDCVVFDASGNHVVGTDGKGKLQVINLDIRRKMVEHQFPHPVYPCESVLENTKTRSILHLKMQDFSLNASAPTIHILLLDMKTGQLLKH